MKKLIVPFRSHLLASCLILSVLMCLLGIQCHEQPGPQTIIIHANTWSDGVIQPFDAVAIDQGAITATGTTEELLKTKGTKTTIIDAGQQFLCPGFTDAHVHFLSGGYNLSAVQLREAASREIFIKTIKEYALTLPKGEWILGGDWNHENWGGQLPERWWIDSITPDHPVAINRLDGHMILCNSLALKLAGVDDAVQNIAGGDIPRNNKQQIIGIFKDNATDMISIKIPPSSEATDDRSLKAAMDYVSSYGVTSVHHMGTFDDLKVFMRNQSSLTTRIYAATPLSQWRELKIFMDKNGRGNMMLQWGMLKGFMDGSLGSHTAAMYQDFTDKPGDRGFLINPLDSMQQWILQSDAAELRVAVHAIGDQAIGDLLNIFDTTISVNGEKDRRFRIEHFQHPTMDQIEHMHRSKVIASMQPYHSIDDGCWAEKVIGPERIKSTYAFKSVSDLKVSLAFGSDWSVAPAIPILGIDAAVNRETLDGKNKGGWVPEQKISVNQALRAYTEGGAYAAFREKELGSIKEGYLADLVLLDQDITTIDPFKIKQTQVLWTMLGGKIVYSRIK